MLLPSFLVSGSLALGVGLVMGLFGGGGAVLTVPILKYVLGHEDKIAIAEALCIVCIVAVGTTVLYARSKHVAWNQVIRLGLGGFAGSQVGSSMAFSVSGSTQFLTLSFVMVVAAFLLLAPPRRTQSTRSAESFLSSLCLGSLIGFLTGFLGVGGGFLMVPVLVSVLNLELTIAVGTSLAIIAANSSAALVRHLTALAQAQMTVDWLTVALFVVLGQTGAIVGRQLGVRLPQLLLKRIFATILILIAASIFIKELAL